MPARRSQAPVAVESWANPTRIGPLFASLASGGWGRHRDNRTAHVRALGGGAVSSSGRSFSFNHLVAKMAYRSPRASCRHFSLSGTGDLVRCPVSERHLSIATRPAAHDRGGPRRPSACGEWRRFAANGCVSSIVYDRICGRGAFLMQGWCSPPGRLPWPEDRRDSASVFTLRKGRGNSSHDQAPSIRRRQGESTTRRRCRLHNMVHPSLRDLGNGGRRYSVRCQAAAATRSQFQLSSTFA
jgi:hypothetical protein